MNAARVLTNSKTTRGDSINLCARHVR